jgi:predicted Rossmann fold flavoprotein
MRRKNVKFVREKLSMRIAIIGGGAAGFMAAITATEANSDAVVTIFEKQLKVLNKVRISGGGRCNVTHNEPDVAQFARHYPRGQHFLRKLMMEFGMAETVLWFQKRGVQLKTEADGRMFPSTNQSETVIRCLANEATRLGITVVTGLGLVAFGKFKSPSSANVFTLKFTTGEELNFDRLLIATGGKPKLSEYKLATEQHAVIDPVPSLFTFHAPKSFLLPLMGVSVQDAEVRIVETKHEWQGPVLITHWGFSGPAILKLSSLGARALFDLDYNFTLVINWLPGYNEQTCKEQLLAIKEREAKKGMNTSSQFGLPSRLWASFIEKAKVPAEMKWADLPKAAIHLLAQICTQSRFEISGKSTFKEEFVTAGGVALTEINTKTMESKSVKGLYFAGEILDVDGITGGFNFQNAWTTGYFAGKNIAIPDPV